MVRVVCCAKVNKNMKSLLYNVMALHHDSLCNKSSFDVGAFLTCFHGVFLQVHYIKTSSYEQKANLFASQRAWPGSCSSVPQHIRLTWANLCLLEITTFMTCTGGKRLKISCSCGVKGNDRESNRDDDYQSRIVHYSSCSL